jgi:hypothetical protein
MATINRKISRAVSRSAISIFVVYHLLCAVTIPQVPNAISDRIRPLVLPYAKLMVMIGTWGFFAPDPGPPPTYLQWEALNKDGESISSGTYPEDAARLFWAERRLRRITSVRFMLQDPDRPLRMMLPYICHKIPAANSVRIAVEVYPVPSFGDVTDGKGQLMDPKTMERKSAGYDFCNRST